MQGPSRAFSSGNGMRRVEQKGICQLQSTETVSAQHDLLQRGGWGETGKGIRGGECGGHFSFFMIEREYRGFQIRSFLWISNLVARRLFLFWGNDQARASLYLNSSVVGVCSTPGALREAPGNPVSSRGVSWTLLMRLWRGQNMARKQGSWEQWHNAENWWNMPLS